MCWDHSSPIEGPFLVKDYLGPLFTTVGTIGHWSFCVFSHGISKSSKARPGTVAERAHFWRQHTFEVQKLFSSSSRSPDQVSALFEVGAPCFKSVYALVQAYIYIYIYVTKFCQYQRQFCTLLSPCPSWSLSVCVLFSEKRLKLVMVNRRECPSQSFWSIDIMKYTYANSISSFFWVHVHFDGRYRQSVQFSSISFISSTNFFGMNQPGRSISIDFWILSIETDRWYQPCSPVGGIKPTVNIDRVSYCVFIKPILGNCPGVIP